MATSFWWVCSYNVLICGSTIEISDRMDFFVADDSSIVEVFMMGGAQWW